MRNRLAVLLCAALIFSALLWRRNAQTQDQSLKLILVVSVDQMRADYLDRFASLYQGGLARLIRQGAVFKNAFYRHASTETGPGHAVLLTGKHGSHSGIVANTWYDSYLKTDVNVVDDPLRVPIGGSGRAGSPANMMAFTIGDVMKQKLPGTRVMSVSIKDRAAILMGGKLADAAYWYDGNAGRFMTSSYYANQLPGWLQKWNEKPYPDAFAGGKWERLKNDPALYQKFAGPDAVEGEWDRIDTVFPHLFRGKPGSAEFYGEFRRMPFADSMILEVAAQMLHNNNLGSGSSPDLLAIGLSTTDYIGHTYGPDSQEVMDQLLRLDLSLGKLFDEIDKTVGLSRVLVVLSADHGVMPLVEILKQRGIDARRIAPVQIEKTVKDALAARFPGADDLVASYYTPSVYLNEQSLAKRKIRREDAEDTIKSALMSTGLVEVVYTQRDFAAGARPEDPVYELFRNAYFAPRSPHVIAAMKQYIYCDDYPGGTTHGSHYDYDRHVPIVFMGAGIKQGAYTVPCGPEDIAPTLAAILKLQFPKEDDARVLSEMLR